MTIVEFLEARLTEDEATGLDLPESELGPPPEGHPFWITTNGVLIVEPRARVLREVAAKRAILSDHEWDETQGSPVRWARELRALASVYADHPDYDQGWALAGMLPERKS